jgi:hypothetical protein
MIVKVTDENQYTSHVLIGENNDVKLSFLLSKIDENTQMVVDLKSNKHSNAGTVTLFLKLEDNTTSLKNKNNEEAILQEIDTKFVKGLLKINTIRGFELKNKNWLSGFNPYLKIKFNDFNGQTAPLNVSKIGAPVFEHLDLETIISKEDLLGSSVQVELWNQSAFGLGLLFFIYFFLLIINLMYIFFLFQCVFMYFSCFFFLL